MPQRNQIPRGGRLFELLSGDILIRIVGAQARSVTRLDVVATAWKAIDESGSVVRRKAQIMWLVCWDWWP